MYYFINKIFSRNKKHLSVLEISIGIIFVMILLLVLTNYVLPQISCFVDLTVWRIGGYLAFVKTLLPFSYGLFTAYFYVMLLVMFIRTIYKLVGATAQGGTSLR